MQMAKTYVKSSKEILFWYLAPAQRTEQASGLLNIFTDKEKGDIYE
jgi:hypothetical protein